MSNIQVLAPHIADLIAAGEVVERPASAAKELMENAVDAGAKHLAVEITHGGLTFLRVTDDGWGIAPEELSTAFLRHATSKLRTQRDLEAIGTLGFRGEALAAIAAVSRIQVTSRTAGNPLGASLSLEGGVPGQVEEAGCPLGTTIVVRDLFYNTPARLKFMKKDAAEGAAVFAAVQRLALSHPEVSVKFIRDGKQELLTPGDGDLQATIYALLGRDLALGFLPAKGSGEDDMAVSGFVSLPACCRGSRTYQHFFVNGRHVKSRIMMAALEEAYKNQKMVGKFPGCVLHLEMRYSAVDVNVHPTKTEVKFGNERAVFSAVYHTVLSALERDRTRPAVNAQQLRPHDSVTTNQTKLAAPPRKGNRVTVESFGARAIRPNYTPPPRPVTAQTPLWRREERDRVAEQPPLPDASLETQTPPYEPREELLAPETAEGSLEVPEEELERGAGPAEPFEPEEAPWRLVGELFHTYIVVEQGDTMLLIDKHAAHERMNFDRMKTQGYTPMSQTLLSPLVVHLPPQEQQALLENLPLLEAFGFQCEDFGGALIVRRAPFDVDLGEIESTLLELAGKLITTGGADPAAQRDELLHTMACKAAIKGGWKTSPQELERVVRAVVSGQVTYCPHGRPVAVELTRHQMEKQFGRIP